MAQLRSKSFILPALLSLLLISLASSDNIFEGIKDDSNQLLHKDINVNSRKLAMMLDAAMQDYDDAGANPKHDPRRRSGNGRSP